MMETDGDRRRLMMTDEDWWRLMKTYGDWWRLMKTERDWWRYDGGMMETDGDWWKTDGDWWMTNGDWWRIYEGLIVCDEDWRRLMKSDESWWRTGGDWLRLMKTDEDWWRLMMTDEGLMKNWYWLMETGAKPSRRRHARPGELLHQGDQRLNFDLSNATGMWQPCRSFPGADGPASSVPGTPAHTPARHSRHIC